MEKLKEHKEIVIIILVAILGAFYWIQIRPVSAKKACSWFTETIHADAGVTKEQADANKKELEQRMAGIYPSKYIPVDRFLLMENSTERPPQPEKEVTREATKTEYDRCLRHSGL